MPTPVLSANLQQPEGFEFQPERWLADVEAAPPIQGSEGAMLVRVAKRIILRYRGDSQRRLAVMEAAATSVNYNGDFEADLNEPMTLEQLAARHRRFLAANQQDWADVDLPSRLE